MYCLDSRSSIDMALRYQNGNSGFGHEIPCLLVVTADLRAFVGSGERNQHWIDGGMFSMSLVLAFHSIGLSTCCLNWSKGPADDLKFRIATGISKHHSIVMLIAVGYPRENIKVCASSRRPVELLYTQMN